MATNKLVTVSTLDEFKTKIEDEIPDSVQYSTMPTASADWVGKIVQYTGSTTASYTSGYFYKCVPGETAGTYEWIPVAVQDGSGEQLVWLGTRAEHTAAETAGTLPETAIIGITDESGGGGGGGSDVIDDENVSTDTTYSSSKIESLFAMELKTFQNCTDAELVEFIAKCDAGEYNPANFWAVGDTRPVTLSAMGTMTGIRESHVQQSLNLVILQIGLYKDVNDKTVNFIVGFVETLIEGGSISNSSTYSGNWNDCPRRAWCNSIFYEAIPISIRPIFKQFKTISAETKTGKTNITSIDYFTLPAEKEIFGNSSYGNQAEQNALQRFEYYKTTSNIQKKKANGDNWHYILRSICRTDSYKWLCVEWSSVSSAAKINVDYQSYGISPFGCI